MCARPPNFVRRGLNILRLGLDGPPVSLDTGLNNLGEHSLKITYGDTEIVTASGAGAILPAVPDQYYILRAFVVSAANIAAGTSTGTSLVCTKFPENSTLAWATIFLVPGVANSVNEALGGLGTVTSPNTAVTVVDLTAAPTTEAWTLFYDTVRM